MAIVKKNTIIAPSRISTGCDGLDDVLGGGIPEGHLYLFEGHPGTGKTTLGLQFLLAGVAAGEKVLYVTLSESRREIEGVAEGHGWALDGVTILEYTPQESGLRPQDQYTAFHPSEIELGDTTQSILSEVEKTQPTRIVFDSLSELRLLARDSLRYRRQILALKQFFSRRQCTVILLDDLTSDAGDNLQLQSIAHGVVLLEKLSREYGKNRRRLEVAKLRGSTFREGYHDYTIETGGVAVCPSLVAAEHERVLCGGLALSGIAEVDELWGGGVETGTSTLIIGPAGVGKSTLCACYSATAAARGARVMFFSFDEGLDSIVKRAAGLGIDLKSHIDSGMIELSQLDPAALSPGAFIQRIREAVELRQAKLLVLDSLNGFIHAMPAEDAIMLQMHELIAYLSQRGVTTILVLSQSGVLGTTMHSPLDLSYLADNMLLLRYFEAQGSVRKAISVVKKRSGEHERTIREMHMSGGKISVGEPLAKFSGVLTGVPAYIGKQSGLSIADERSQG